MKIKKLSSMILTLSILVGSTQIEARNSSRAIAKKIAKYALTGAKGVGAGLYGILMGGSLFLAVMESILVVRPRQMDLHFAEFPLVLRQGGPVGAAMLVSACVLSAAAHGYAAHKCMQSFLDDLTGEEETSEEGKST